MLSRAQNYSEKWIRENIRGGTVQSVDLGSAQNFSGMLKITSSLVVSKPVVSCTRQMVRGQLLDIYSTR